MFDFIATWGTYTARSHTSVDFICWSAFLIFKCQDSDRGVFIGAVAQTSAIYARFFFDACLVFTTCYYVPPDHFDDVCDRLQVTAPNSARAHVSQKEE